MTPKNKQLLFLTVVLPVLTYGFQLWYRPKGKGCKTILRKLEGVQHAAAHWITGGFCTSPSGALEMLTGLAPVWVNLDKLYLKSGVCLASLHPHCGIHAFQLPPLNWTEPTDDLFLLLPGHCGPCAAPPGPIASLAATTSLLVEPSAFHPDNCLGLHARDLYLECILALSLPAKSLPLEGWASDISAIIDKHRDHPTYFVTAAPPGDIFHLGSTFGIYLLEFGYPPMTIITPPRTPPIITSSAWLE